MRKTLTCVVLLLFALPGWVLADGGDDDPVSRNEALALKTAVKSVIEALGAPPAGYAMATEDYDLPTSMGYDKSKKVFYLTQTGADLEYTNGMSGEQLGQEYQTRIMAAQAKGDYAEMQRLSMELQQNMGAAMGTEMSKIKVRVYLNHNPHQEIDPEGVLWETPGAIALRTGTENANAQVLLAFDPKALADTQKVSLVNLGETLNGSSDSKTAVRTIVVELEGPEAAVTEWVQNVDKGKMLGLITK